MMAKFKYDKDLGRMVDKDTGEPMVNHDDWTPTVPLLLRDNVEYHSPITGELISGKQHEKRHMKEHNVIHTAEFGREKKRLKNERFIKKHGLQHLAD